MVELLAIVVWPALFLFLNRATTMSPYLCWIASGSIVTFFVYGLDKGSAKLGLWRVSEKTLHLLSLFGGFAGAALGLILWHHKFQKGVFIAIILLSAFLHFGLISGLASAQGW